MMQPRPGLVFKTRTLPAKGSGEEPRKVFINVVMHELVKKPLNAAMEEVGLDHIQNVGIANLRVPLDVGEARPCADNSGDLATAVDVIFHPCLVECARNDSPGPTIMGQPRHLYYQVRMILPETRNPQFTSYSLNPEIYTLH